MNNIGTLHLSDKDFLPEQAANCELLIRVSSTRLSYAIVEKPNRKIRAIFDGVLSHSIRETFAELLLKNSYLSYPFQKTKIAAESFRFAFIPSELYSEDTAALCYNFVSSSIPFSQVSNPIAGNRISTIGSVSNSLSAPFTEKYQEASLYTQAEAFIEGMLKHPREGQTLALQFNTGTFEALLTSGDELIFYNIFQAPTADDFNYFLLLLIQQLQINTTETSVLLSGEIEKYSEHYRRVLKYFRNIHFADSTTFCQYSDTFRLIPSHQFFSLLSLGLCE